MNELTAREIAESEVALYEAEARERGRPALDAGTRARMVAQSEARIVYRREHPSEPKPGPMSSLSTLLPKLGPARPYKPEPVEITCAPCSDSGVVVGPRPRLESRVFAGSRVSIPGIQAAPIWGGRALEPGEALLNCADCPPAFQRARNLAGTMHPDDVRECRFSAYEPTHPTQRDAMALAQRWATDADGRPFLILVGPTGTGKSHIAKAAILYRVEHGERAVWQTAEGILEAIRATFDKLRDEGAEEDPARRMVRREWERVPLLAIDDVGAGYETPWAMREIEQVIMSRYEHRIPTVITSNLNLEDLARRQDDPFGRLVSRLADERRTIYVEVSGDDYREGVRDGGLGMAGHGG